MKHLMLLSVAILATVTLLPVASVAQLVEQEPAQPKQGYSIPSYADQMRELEDSLRFSMALQSGNLAEVKHYVEMYPDKKFLTTPVKLGKNDRTELPITVAVEGGYDNIIEYMYEQNPEIIDKDCPDSWTGEDKFVGRAIRYKYVDTAILLLNYGAPICEKDATEYTPNTMVLLSETARNIKDKKELKKLIPALLDAGASLTYKTSNRGWYSNVFYIAAWENNNNFMDVLLDEMQKRNIEKPKKVVVIENSCPPAQYARLFEEFKAYNKSAIEFLEKYGMKISFDVKETWYGCD